MQFYVCQSQVCEIGYMSFGGLDILSVTFKNSSSH